MGGTSNQQPWSDEHTLAVIRGIITTILTSRQALYAMPELAKVSNNGGDRINKKLQQVLKSMAGSVGAEGMVAEELAKLGRTKKGSAGGGSQRASARINEDKDKVKQGRGSAMERRKKRKVQQEGEEGASDEKPDVQSE